MALSSIGLEETKEPTYEAKTKVSILGASQPAPKIALVAIKIPIVPLENNRVTAETNLSFIPFVSAMDW